MLIRTFIPGIIAVFIAFGSNFSSSTAQTSGKEEFNRQAYEHFRNGLLYKMQGNTAGAIEELIRANQFDNDNPVIMKALGDIYVFDANNYGMGAAVYEKYLEMEPFQDRVIDIVMQIYLGTRPPRTERAEYVLTTVINKGNNQPKYYANLTDLLLQQKKLEQAQNTAVNFINRTGESQETCAQVAEIFIKNSMVLEGIEYFSNYLKNNPGSVNTGITVGRLHEARDDFNAAEKAYSDVLKKNETAYLARLFLAEMYSGTGRLNDALNLYKEIDFDDPMEIDVKLRICQQLLQRTPDVPYAEIESIMESVKEKAGSNAQVFYYLGLAQAGQERHAEAVENFNRSLHEDPLNAVVLYYLTQSEFEQEHFKEAEKAISRAVQLIPEELAFYVLQGLIYDRLEDFENLEATYESAIAIPETPMNRSARATLLNNYSYHLSLRDKNLDKALEMAKIAVRTEPENSSFLDTIGWVYFKLDNLDEALVNIKKAADKDQTNAEILDHLGDVYLKKGDIELAVTYWEKALENDKENEKIKEKIRKYKK